MANRLRTRYPSHASLPSPGPTYDTDAQAWFVAVEGAGGLISSGRKTLIDSLVSGLKADGVWPLLDRLHLLAAENAGQALRDLRKPTKLSTPFNAPVFTADRGYSFDGSSSYLDNGEPLTTSGNQLALNSVTVGAWSNTGSGKGHMLGLSSASANFYLRSAGVSSATAALNGSVGAGITVASTTGTFHLLATRANSSAIRMQVNGGAFTDVTTASSAIPTGNTAVARQNTNYGTARIASFFYGSAMTDTQMTAIHNRLNTFLSAIGGA